MAKDKLLFTPGPLTTSDTVKSVMQRDLDSGDPEFVEIVREIRETLLEIASVSQDDGYEVILMPGSGTFGLESVIGSGVPRDGNLMVVVNGACADRVLEMTDRLRIRTVVYRTHEDEVPDPDELDRRIAESRTLTNVHVVHCETSTGILNPIEDLGPIVKRHRKTLSVDAVTSFGAMPIDIKGWGIDYLVTSSSLAIESIPGVSAIFAKRATLERCEGRARSLSLDLYEQWRSLERTGQLRFTPPVQSLLALRQALSEFLDEGGMLGRGMRYHRNQQKLVEGMRELGFETFIPDELQSHVISTFRYPDDRSFNFEMLQRTLAERGFVISPGMTSQVKTFRIGSFGRIGDADISELLKNVGGALAEIGVPSPG